MSISIITVGCFIVSLTAFLVAGGVKLYFNAK